uniref:Methyltransferase domain-containing protein n=1 Tax=Wuchereria bancrofti TaxID=6293 RepID=A0A1I8F0K7_WUCBA
MTIDEQNSSANGMFLTSSILVFSDENYNNNQFIQVVLLDDLLINGRHRRIEDIAIREYDGSLFIQRVLKLIDIGPFAVASMALEIPPEKQNAAKLDTSLLPLNHSKILIPYIQAMAAAPFALEAIQLEKNGKIWNILEIGLGTGILNSFLHNIFSSMNITAIELERGMYEIAKKYFGLIEDNYQRVIIEDGIQYLQRISNEPKYDVIFIDACYDRIIADVICPVETFMLEQNLKIVKKALTKNGIIVLSVLACGEYRTNKTEFVRKLKEIYKKFGFDSQPNIE